MDLKKYGITGVTEIVYNPSYDELFREETKKGLRGFEKGQLTETGAVNVMTGVYTGRSPKDKFFVMDETTKDTISVTPVIPYFFKSILSIIIVILIKHQILD